MAKPVKAVPPEFIEGLAEINAATNEVAAAMEAEREKTKTAMTPQEVADHKAALTSLANRLRGIAADPNNPVPPTP